MDYAEAVRLAKAGEDKGFNFLYEETYKSKYYLALQYMKNEEAAQDVLQEAYMKAFAKLDMLELPEAFPAWFGTIVGNTAKNMLKKNNPMLFSDVAVDDENESFEYQIEDDTVEHQPEIAYTRQETQELVHELIDALSEEQRMCILMFHIDGASIREIASALDCSENTVKSRLKYGRDNLKTKAEELQKKGYKLYSIAPLPLLLYLLRSEEAYLSASGALTMAGEDMAKHIFRPSATTKGVGMSAGSKGTASNGVKTAIKSGFLHTTAGKVAIVVVGICVAGGAVFYGVSQMKSEEPKPETEVVQEQSETESEQPPETEETPTVKELKDEEYASLIAGNLTKEELEFVLAYGPQEIPVQGFQDSDHTMILNTLCEGSEENGSHIEDYGPDANWKSRYSLSDVNRMFLAFTTYQFTEENDDDTEYGIDVDGEVITFHPASLSATAKAVITLAEYTEEEMNVYFTYGYRSVDMAMEGIPEEIVDKKAVLKPTENGLYRIVKIEEVESEAEQQNEQASQQSSAFPIGTYSYVAGAGGLRTSLTIDSSGIATIKELYSGNGEVQTITYQMSVDNTVTVPDGVTAYLLQPVNGGDNRAVSYDVNQSILSDITGQFDWERTE